MLDQLVQLPRLELVGLYLLHHIEDALVGLVYLGLEVVLEGGAALDAILGLEGHCKYLVFQSRYPID